MGSHRLNPLFVLPLEQDWQRLPDLLWRRQWPEPLPQGVLADLSPAALRLLQLDADALQRDADSLAWLRSLHAGEQGLPGLEPLAQPCAGHRYGRFAPQQEGGSGLLLGAVVTPLGRLDLFLKGAGRTPFTRHRNGRLQRATAVREYLVSHALHGLGIPTSLPVSLCVHEQAGADEPAATLLRLATSHVRIGHFEWLFHQGTGAHVRALVQSLQGCFGEGPQPDDVLGFYQRTVRRSARLVAAWQVWGFVHGALHTDNLSVLGLTLGQGRGRFMEVYRPSRAAGPEDRDGRYAYDQQPTAMAFGLAVLAQALSGVVPLEALSDQLERFDGQVESAWVHGMCSRLGLMMRQEGDVDLVRGWLSLLQRGQCDYHRSFRALMRWHEHGDDRTLASALAVAEGSPSWEQWLAAYRRRLQRESATGAERRRFLAGMNPRHVLREAHLKSVLGAMDEGDFGPLAALRQGLTQPFSRGESGLFTE